MQHESAATVLTLVTFRWPSTACGPAPVTSTDRIAVSSHREAQSIASAHSGLPLVAVLVAVRSRLRLFAAVRTTDLTCAAASREPRRTGPDQALIRGFVSRRIMITL
jgi:hypothetical protein